MRVSIILTIKNESLYIKKCLDAIFNQSYQDFEIIIIDDSSTDGTLEIVSSYEDKRIRLFPAEKDLGHAGLRNFAVKKASGTYIFFTDGDCVPHYNWLDEGLRVFEREGCVGVEGRTFYEAESGVTVSDYYTQRVKPEGYMTCNVAYMKSSIVEVGYFDPKFKYVYEDRDLGLRIKKTGKIFFESNMLVFHQQKKLNVRTLFRRAKRAGDMVYFDFKHGRSSGEYIKSNVLYPNHLLMIMFPPLVFLGARNESLNDLVISFFKYFGFIYERILIWVNAIKYGRFVI
jgi:glycosyltransferase involved in cell wall biosynthesis